MKYMITFTEEELRVIANACESLYNKNTMTRDGMIAHKIEIATRNILIPEHTASNKQTPEIRRIDA